jgi:hypothetical protein
MILPVRCVAVTDAQAGHLTASPDGLPLRARFADTPNGAPGARTKGAPGGARFDRPANLTESPCIQPKAGRAANTVLPAPVSAAVAQVALLPTAAPDG